MWVVVTLPGSNISHQHTTIKIYPWYYIQQKKLKILLTHNYDDCPSVKNICVILCVTTLCSHCFHCIMMQWHTLQPQTTLSVYASQCDNRGESSTFPDCCPCGQTVFTVFSQYIGITQRITLYLHRSVTFELTMWTGFVHSVLLQYTDDGCGHIDNQSEYAPQ